MINLIIKNILVSHLLINLYETQPLTRYEGVAWGLFRAPYLYLGQLR